MKKLNILGREVSILVVLGIIMVAGVSGALLTYYGRITGTATVQQSVLVDGTTYETDTFFSFDGDTVNGQKVIELHDMENQAGVDTTVQFATTCDPGAAPVDSASPSSAMDIDWDDTCDGILTRYVEYYDDAVADFSGYAAPACDVTVTAPGTIQAAVDAATGGEVICVDAGTYAEHVNVDKDVTLAALNAPDSVGKAQVDGSFTVLTDGVTIMGFSISNTGLSGEQQGIFVGNPGVDNEDAGKTVLLESNLIDGVDSTDKTVEGIHVKSYDAGWGIDGVTIQNNVIRNVNSASKGANAIKLQAGLTNVDVNHNTFSNIQGGWTHVIAVTYSSGEAGLPQADITWNTFDVDNGDAIGVEADASLLTVMYNNFMTPVDLSNRDETQANGTETLVAHDNWFGTDGIVTLFGPVDADWQTKSDLLLEAGEFDAFGVINDFNIALMPDTYTLTLEVQP